MKRIKTAFRQAVKGKLIFGSAFAEVVAGDQSNDERKSYGQKTPNPCFDGNDEVAAALALACSPPAQGLYQISVQAL